MHVELQSSARALLLSRQLLVPQAGRKSRAAVLEAVLDTPSDEPNFLIQAVDSQRVQSLLAAAMYKCSTHAACCHSWTYHMAYCMLQKQDGQGTDVPGAKGHSCTSLHWMQKRACIYCCKCAKLSKGSWTLADQTLSHQCCGMLALPVHCAHCSNICRATTFSTCMEADELNRCK